MERALVVGLGTIGFRMARTLSRFMKVDGKELSKELLQRSLDCGAIDRIFTGGSMADYSLVAVCLHPRDTIEFIESRADNFARDTLVFDTCEIKGIICDTLDQIALKHRFYFIGTHPVLPIDTPEQNLFGEADFSGGNLIITPGDSASLDSVEQMITLSKRLGFETNTVITPEEHDRAVASLSFLPRLLSNAFLRLPETSQSKTYQNETLNSMLKNGYLDPELSSELFIGDKTHLLESLDRLSAAIDRYKNAISSGNDGDLTSLIREGNDIWEVLEDE